MLQDLHHSSKANLIDDIDKKNPDLEKNQDSEKLMNNNFINVQYVYL